MQVINPGETLTVELVAQHARRRGERERAGGDGLSEGIGCSTVGAEETDHMRKCPLRVFELFYFFLWTYEQLTESRKWPNKV